MNAGFKLTKLEQKAVIAKLGTLGLHVRADIPFIELAQIVREMVGGKAWGNGVPRNGVSHTDIMREFLAPPVAKEMMARPFKQYVEPQAMRDAVARAQEWRKIPSLVVRAGVDETK